MDQNIKDFESLLKGRSLNKALPLYARSKNNTSNISAQEVLSHVSRQVKAIQNADTASSKRVSKTHEKYMKREFLPVDRIPVCREVPQRIATKFETQCVSDTQLIDVVENAEIIDNHRGVTQEFDKTFCHKSNNDDKLNDSSSKSDPIIDTHIEKDINYPQRSISPKGHETLNNQDRSILNSPDFLTCDMDTVTFDINDAVTESKSRETQGFNTCMEVIDKVEIDTEIPTSPVLNAIKRNSTPPLVVDLYTFEKFENIAVPVIEEQRDLKLAKDMINSQIIGREITIPNRFSDTIGRDSPVFSKIERITTNINEDELEKICTCSNNCVGKGMMSTNEEMNKDETVSTGNKKTDSKIAKTEINDEILFSSDEESEYLHKKLHELPLTCALETSFYDTSDVLDKTMFVGFQTASNKSIQINTESFTKAKSILCGVDNESTGTSLSELVKIFDSGRAISEKVQSIQMSSNDNQISSKVDKDAEKGVTSPFQITIGDEFRNVSLTALGKDEKVDEDINVSQVIQFKSVLSNKIECSNDNKSFPKIEQDENRDSTQTCRNTDAIKNASLTELEPDEEVNEDFVMSQVIEVKSALKNKVDFGQTNSKIQQDENIASTLPPRNTPGSEETRNCTLKNESVRALQHKGKINKDIDMRQIIEFNSMLMSKLECNYDTQNCSKIEQEENRDSMQPCQNTDDTFSNASLTALERDGEVNKKVVMSQIIEFTSTLQSKQDFGQTNPKVEKEENKYLTLSLRNNPHSGETIDSTFRNVSLTALEQEEKADEEIVMSQVISFKSTLRPATLDDSMCKQNTPDIFDKPDSTVLEQNKDIDDDVIVSQVIPFKSISRTPNIKNIRNPRVNDESHTSKAIVKRKLEGFKTAGNKKIKLSEKSLARCKKVFKDIDLEDDNENCQPDFVELENDFLIDVKFDDFNLSHDSLKANSEIDKIRDSKNDMCDNVSEQSCFEKVDLQINDQILLQEFQDNQMPFEEANNNAWLGFKTASNKNNAISAALAATKNGFQDIMSISTTNDSDSAIKTVENTGIKSKKCDNYNLFKKPSVDSRKADVAKSKMSTDSPLKFNSGTTQQKIKDDPRVINSTQKSKNAEFVGFEIASHKDIISEQAKEKPKTFYKDLIEVGINDDEPKSTCNLNAKKKYTYNSEDDFNCGIDTQDFLAQVLTDVEDLSKDNTTKNKTPASPIFQGFQTASRKPVVISEKALEMSKKLFEDITNKECVMQCNLQNKIAECNKTLSRDLVTSNQLHNTHKKESTQAIKSKDSKNIAEDLRSALEGNSKENKTVAIKTQTHASKESDIAKKVIKQFGLKGTECALFVGFKTASAKPIHISTEAMEKTKILLSDFELKYNEITFNEDYEVTLDTEPSSSTYVAFNTASNKNITVSAKALAKTKQMLNNFEVKDDSSQFNDDKVETTTHNALDHFETNNEFENDFTNDSSTPSTTTFMGLQPGSNTDVNISEEALTKSRPIYQPKENDQWGREDTSVFCGFQTASNKKVEISADALAKSKHLFEDMNVSQIVKKLKPIVKSDENNEITVMKEPVYVTNSLGGFETAKNKKVTLSEQSLPITKEVYENMDKARDNNYFAEDDAPPFKGFQTASNKKVEISEKALSRSRKLFEDIKLSPLDEDAKINHDISAYNFVGLQRASNNKVKVSDQALSKTKDIFKTAQEERNLMFKGFQTASNKKVEISDKALAKGRKLFDGINMSQLDNYRTTTEDIPANDFGGFQTASNKKVEVLEEALSKTKDIFGTINEEKDNYSIADDTIPMFKGFQTASNKKVEISDKALAKSKKLFDDINLSQLKTDPKITEDIPSNDFGGFQTASNKKVNVSDEALLKSKDVFTDIHLESYSSTKNTAPAFKGFQTASDKIVVISEKALAKSKKLFENINLSQLSKEPIITNSNELHNQEKKVNYNEETDNKFGSFQTANNKRVKLSQQVLAKSRDTFKNVETPEDKTDVHAALNNVKLRSTDDFIVNKALLDTQVLNDFQETLNTEDFGKTTPTSRRSGSPILSCPKAKKRKFATPYRTTKKKEAKAFVPPKIAKTYDFNNIYKKEKKYNLKDIQKLERENVTTDFDPYITEFSFDNLLNFEFKGERNDVNTKKMTIDDLKKIFLGSINNKIVPDGWLDNHIKLITWKLLSYEVKFPNVMKNICTVKNVLEQLKYRYDRELYHVQRPILRKILEKDEMAAKTMVLCVAAVYIDNISVTSVTQTSQNVEILLTDGWYCVKACLDRMLTRLVTGGAIVVGTKLAVCGAELMNCEQGLAPWEDTSSVRLKLHGNGVRRAHWLARLGPRNELIQCSLNGAKSDGGKMAAVRVYVTRVYPPLYVEKMEDGSTVTLSERLEHMRQVKHESERQTIMEKLYEEVEKEMSDQDSQDSEGYTNDKSCLDSGSQIYKRMKESKDPDEYRSNLTKSQTRMLEDHNAKQREKLIERVRQKFQQKLDKNGLTDRNVIPLLKVRVAGFVEKIANVEVTKGYLSIWKPSAAVLELVTEGAWIEILNLTPSGIRNSEIQLSAGRQTIFNPYRQTNEKFQLFTKTLQRKCYEIKEITHNPSMTTYYNELDTVGLIFCIEPSTKDFKEQSFQNVYLADADKNIICVNFWGGLKKFCYENVLDTGQIITCVNLQKRAGNTRKSIPQYRATEFSYFTKTPKYKKALEITNELASKLMKIKEKFCEDCILIKSNYSIFKTRDSDVSPYRFEYNVPKNMVTPLRNCDANLNLTGLDFESSFNSQEVSPQMLLRKKRVTEKIEKIRLNYGEPPPLSSIHIINKSKNASATYKSPLISNLERSKMAESSLQYVASPVTINRTFVKNVNPVKLNFSSENLDESVDHFAEDFDASPPLSLDSQVLN